MAFYFYSIVGFLRLGESAVGKSGGIGKSTLPVASHSVTRTTVVW